MIGNERQLRISRRKLADLEQHLQASTKDSADGTDVDLVAAGLTATIETLRNEIASYEQLALNRPTVLELGGIEELPEAAISARIAAGLTQAELAQRLGVPEQSVQRYEQNRYARVSFDRLRDIFLATGIRVVIH